MYFPPLLFPKLCGRRISVHALLKGNKFCTQPHLPTNSDLDTIAKLCTSGISRIGIANFCDGASSVFSNTATAADFRRSHLSGLQYTGAVATVADAKRALLYGVNELCVYINASSINRSSSTPTECETAINQVEQIADFGKGHVITNLFILDAFGNRLCPSMSEDDVLDLGDYFWNSGFDTITLCDQQGFAHPVQVERLCDGLIDRWKGTEVSLYFKNAHGIGLANVIAGMTAGIESYVVDANDGNSGTTTEHLLPDIKLADFLYLLEGLDCLTVLPKTDLPSEPSSRSSIKLPL